ncbi:DNA-processing protein DprA [Anaerococcus porci]|uniref:DNA-processing protein DprA n=1 Tax=Anaerococcus porci TaxID=2652269 RepID=UPI002A761D96|nr:DNA-processing protein DprA [Anaerococcus porci]MDY3006781.1 DNA-processing protein DprA [Anaerococcus porci]
MKKRELLIYLNFIYLQNSLILDFCENLDMENFFDLDRKIFNKLSKKNYDKIFSPKNLESFKYYKEKIIKGSYKVSTIYDKDYPENLKNIYDKPALLFYKGEIEEDDKYAIAFIGARKCTDYGKWATKKIVEGFKDTNIRTVSGLAYGIDAISHKVSLDNGIKTIGVLGCGIDKIYPKKNKFLYDKMENEGLIISEFPLGTEPISYNFPRRNRIISGISRGVCVIEAKEKSGTMITTNFALEQGRDVFCLPGNINSIYSKGCNKLIQEGSKLVMDASDIIDEIEDFKNLKTKKTILNLDLLDKDSVDVVKYIIDNPSSSADDISINLSLPIEDVSYILISLELKDYIENIGNNEYVSKGD